MDATTDPSRHAQAAHLPSFATGCVNPAGARPGGAAFDPFAVHAAAPEENT